MSYRPSDCPAARQPNEHTQGQRPLELAEAGGRALAARGDVTFAYDPAPAGPGREGGEAGRSLRMLAVFSLPTATTVLALRRERVELARLVRRIAARSGAGWS